MEIINKAITWVKENKITAIAFAVAGIGIIAYMATSGKKSGAGQLSGYRTRRKNKNQVRLIGLK